MVETIKINNEKKEFNTKLLVSIIIRGIKDITLLESQERSMKEGGKVSAIKESLTLINKTIDFFEEKDSVKEIKKELRNRLNLIFDDIIPKSLESSYTSILKELENNN